MKTKTATLTALCLALATSNYAQQPGTLDGDFNGTGKVSTDFDGGTDFGASTAVQPDGKIIVAGYASNGFDDDFAVVRYNTDGSLDNSFSLDGKATTDFGMGNDRGSSVVLQSDGKIVLAGSTSNGSDIDLALVRYNTDGTLDNSFGVAGKMSTDFGSSDDLGLSLAIQPDGKLLVAGYTTFGSETNFALARYTAEGTLDNSFSVDGKVTADFGSSNSLGQAVALQPDGKIVVSGSASNGSDEDFAVVRFNSDGTLDNSFSGDGKVTTDFAMSADAGNSVAIQPDGKIVVSGYGNIGSGDVFLVVRYNADGTLDNSFSVDGKVSADFGGGLELGTALTIQLDGKIVVAGYSGNTNADFALVRFNTDGTLDNSFSMDGKVTTAFGANGDFATSVALQPDGKIVVGGYTYAGSNVNFAVARYISGLNIGIVEFSFTNTAPLIYPNPIAEHATLEYTLQEAETLSIQLLDLQGKTLLTFVEGQAQAAGEHQQAIELPASLPAGPYLLVLASPKGKATVQVVK